MMRGVVISVFLMLMLAGFASASFICADNKTIKQDVTDLSVGQVKTANSLYLGLSKALETPVFKRMDAEVLIDAQKLDLINGTASYALFSDGTNQSVTLVNSTNSAATITIGSGTKSIYEGSEEPLGGFEIFVVNSDDMGNVKILIGRSKLVLSNLDNPSDLITYNNKKYAVEIFSASDDNALIRVYKCANDSITIIEKVEVVNTTQPAHQNGTANQTVNDTNAQSNSSVNNTNNNASINNNSAVNSTNSPPGNNSDVNENVGEGKFDKILKYIIIGGIGLIAIIFIIVLIRTIRDKES